VLWASRALKGLGFVLLVADLCACRRYPLDEIPQRPLARAPSGEQPERAYVVSPLQEEFEGKDFYLCCNMRFNANRDANDANYAYPNAGGNMLRVGARVHVIEAAGHGIVLRAEGSEQSFNLGFKFGRERISTRQYFRNILRDADPRESLGAAPRDVLDAINEGHLVVGMTKDEALMARGYPPFHHTAGVESDEWTYYFSRGYVDVVKFVDGKIESIERAPAP
jgi:hypothetical protein